MADGIERFLCIASYEKGHDFLRQCAEMGVRPTLLTLDKLRDAPWPLEVLEELATMPAGLNREQILNTVSWMARAHRFDRIIALDEFDLETAAQVREHMRIPGMGVTTSAYYRDKLAMRIGARESGFLVPDFCRVLNYDELRGFMSRVPPPWLLKPRSEASSLGIRRIEEPEQLWRILDELGDRQSHFLLEQFVPGDIFHVDSIVSERNVLFSAVHQYGRPPMQVMHEGGVFTTRTVDRASYDWAELTALNAGAASPTPNISVAAPMGGSTFLRLRLASAERSSPILLKWPPASISGASGQSLRSNICAAVYMSLRNPLRAMRAAYFVLHRPRSRTPPPSTTRRSFFA
jgi:hypothetical protein